MLEWNISFWWVHEYFLTHTLRDCVDIFIDALRFLVLVDPHFLFLTGFSPSRPVDWQQSSKNKILLQFVKFQSKWKLMWLTVYITVDLRSDTMPLTRLPCAHEYEENAQKAQGI